MFKLLLQLLTVLGGILLGIPSLLDFRVLAEPISSTALSNDPTLVDKIETEPLKSDSCPNFTPITNTLPSGTRQGEYGPDISSAESEENKTKIVPTSACAADLTSNDLESVETARETFITQENILDKTPQLTPSNSEETASDESNQWHFSFQPYVTVPVTTYGTATARGKTVNYHLSLGELLQDLRATASGRVEAWKGRWGFIVDGYYVSLQGIGSVQNSFERTPNTIDALNYLLSKDVNTRVQEITNTLDQNVQQLQQVQSLQGSQAIDNLNSQVQTIKETAILDAQTLQQLNQQIQDFQGTIVAQGEDRLQALDFKLQDIQQLGLNSQALQEIITLNNQAFQRLPAEQQLDTKIQNTLNTLEDLGQLQQQLIETKNLVEQTRQEVQEQRAIQDSEDLRLLATNLENAQATLERNIAAINQIQEFSENRETQQVDSTINSDLQFDQGIYDFAVSYHFGELPLYELPNKPSNRAYPLVWFEPIAGVRLNDINIEIDNTIDLQFSSSLVNVQGTFQETFQQERIWFEPMLGAKLGLQISDPLIFWVRGDVSGFGLAGETDLSWNLFFGIDWWVAHNISLQLAYRFYGIDYKNGSGNNAYGFEQNFNGPVFSATLHF